MYKIIKTIKEMPKKKSFFGKHMKVRNQAGVCLWENIFQPYNMLIVCSRIDRKSSS